MNNDKHREYWNGPMADAWITRLDPLERAFSGINAVLMTFAGLKSGMNVLDIGCGPGVTTGEIARRVSPGRAVGLDISAKLIDAAISRFGVKAEFIEADAADYPFKPEFELVFSRLGLMFFADPVRAFANIRKALKPGGRLASLVWAPLDEIPYLVETISATRDLFPPLPPVQPNEPGRFALADGTRTRSLLEAAGWSDVRLEKVYPPSLLGRTLDEAVEFTLNGPNARAFREADAAVQAEARARVRPLLARYQTEDGIAPLAACWLIGATA